MSRLKFLLIPVSACVVFLLTSSMKQPAAPLASIPSIKKPSPIKPLELETIPMPSHLQGVPAATILNEAIARSTPKNVRWLQMDILQETSIDDISYKMKARYLRGPKELVRFDAAITIGGLTSHLKVISDGNKVQEIIDVPGCPKESSLVDLPAAEETTFDASLVEPMRANALRSKTFPGIAMLLNSIRTSLREPSVRTVRCEGEDLIEIKGKWIGRETTQEQVPAELRIHDQAFECRVCLNLQTLWPHHIEWLGAMDSHETRQLLMRTEFLHVAVNQPLGEERIRQEFTVKSESRAKQK